MDTLKGMGIFLQALKPMKETPEKAAKLCKDNGVSNVAIYSVHQERSGLRQIDSVATMRRYRDAFKKAGISVWLWAFPYAGREREFVDALKEHSDAVKPDGWILDPEVSYKWKTPAQKRPKRKAALDLVEFTLDAASNRIGLAWTSYGMVEFHKNFPWADAQIGTGIPQLYLPDVVNSTQAAALVDRGLTQWNKLDPYQALVPAVPAFGANSGAKMHDFLSGFVDGAEEIDGMLVWSWPQISKDEWRVIARWSDWFKRMNVGGR